MTARAVELDYQLTDEDLIDGALAVAEGSKARRALTLGTLAAAGALMIGTVLLAGGGATGMGMAALALSGLALFQRLVVPRIQREQLLASLREGRNLYLRGRQHLVYDEQGVALGNWAMETRVRWAAIERVECSQRVVLLFFGGGRALMVPRRAFGSEVEVSGFVEQARRLGSAALLELAAAQEPGRR
jgi:hypothetical protein